MLVCLCNYLFGIKIVPMDTSKTRKYPIMNPAKKTSRFMIIRMFFGKK
jgi:hypothetical protein